MPSQHGIQDFLNDKQFPNNPGVSGQTLISELLHDAGYYTGLVGKWHCGDDRTPHPGFDSWFGYWVNQYPHEGVQNFSDQGKLDVENGQQSPLLTNHALDFLHKHRTDPETSQKPYFLYISYVDTHNPHNQAPPELVQLYTDATFKDFPDEELPACHGKANNPKLPPARERHRQAEYYAAATSVDREVGRILDDLAANGEQDNTFIMYTGDHGLNAGHHGIWEKGAGTTPQNFFEESIRVACTVSWPNGGVKPNGVSEDFVNHCDTWATVLDAAGVKPDKASIAKINSPGVSYLPQLLGETATKWKDAQIVEYGNARMIRTTKYKLIVRYPYGGAVAPSELYDIVADPRETVNLYDEPNSAAVVAELTDRLNNFFAKYSIPGKTGLDLDKQIPANGNPPWVQYANEHGPQPAPPSAPAADANAAAG